MEANSASVRVDVRGAGEPKAAGGGAVSHRRSSILSRNSPWLSRFVRARWSLLFPLYRRVDVAGLHDFAVIELIVIAVYAAINIGLVAASLVRIGQAGASDPLAIQSNANNIGRYANSNVLLLLLPVARNSIWQYIFGISYDRAVRYHRYIAHVAVAEIVIHGSSQLSVAWYQGQFSELFFRDGVHGVYTAGPIAASAAISLFLTSLYPIRRLLWKVFLWLHLSLFVLFIVFAFIHASSNRNTIAFGLALYAVDRLLRIISWSRRATITSICALPGDITRITFEKVDFHYEAGQFVFVCIPAISPFEWHPFSVSSSPHQSVVTIHCKAVGGWTRRLYQLAIRQATAIVTAGVSMPLLFVEGPYGCLSLPLERYDSFLMVAGGIGITPLNSVYNELVHQHYAGQRVIRRMSFVWAVREAEVISSLYADVKRRNSKQPQTGPTPPAVAEMPWHYVGRSALSAQDRLIVPKPAAAEPSVAPLASRCVASFHITGTPQQQQPQIASADSPAPELPSDWDEDWITRGRPMLQDRLGAMAAALNAHSEADGGKIQRCAVMLCGPAMLVKDVQKACIRQSRGKVRFDIHEETFQW